VSILVLIIGSALLWRPGETPLLLFAFVFPWLQASVAIFYSNWLGIGVGDFASFSSDMPTAVFLSLAGLLTVAAGMRLGAGSWRWEDAYGFRKQVFEVPFKKWLQLYIIGWVASCAFLSFAYWVIPGLLQLMLGLVAIKWALFFMLAYAVFTGAPRGKFWFAIVFIVELLSGIGGYFSDFKVVLFVTVFAAFASGRRLTLGALAGLVSLGTLLLGFGIVWQTVKGDFRRYVSGGAAAQIVTVDYLTRMEKLAELVGALNADKLALGVDDFLRRVSYVEYFGAVLTYVPSVEPHQHGAILWDAVSRPLMPRLFFAEKTVIDDTARTNLYTGGMAGDSEATSISLGYVAESYIDFGYVGMFAELLLIGVFFGLVYRALVRWKSSRGLLGSALATAVLVGACSLDSSFTKTFGGIIASLLVAWAFAKFFVPRWLPG
jgi:hypothetical protein